MLANDTWKIYLDTGDITKTVELGEGAGAQISHRPCPSWFELQTRDHAGAVGSTAPSSDGRPT